MNFASHFSFSSPKEQALRLLKEKPFALKEQNTDFVLLCVWFQFIMSVCASFLSVWLRKCIPWRGLSLTKRCMVAFWSQAADMHRSQSQDHETLKMLPEGVRAKFYLSIYLFIFHCGKPKHLAVFSQWSSADVALGFIQKVTVPKGWYRGWELRTSISSRLCRPLHLFVFPIPTSPASCIQTVNLSWRSCCVYMRAGTMQVSMSRNDSENCDTVAAIHVFH